jgi:hypothetical protein
MPSRIPSSILSPRSIEMSPVDSRTTARTAYSSRTFASRSLAMTSLRLVRVRECAASWNSPSRMTRFGVLSMNSLEFAAIGPGARHGGLSAEQGQYSDKSLNQRAPLRSLHTTSKKRADCNGGAEVERRYLLECTPITTHDRPIKANEPRRIPSRTVTSVNISSLSVAWRAA